MTIVREIADKGTSERFDQVREDVAEDLTKGGFLRHTLEVADNTMNGEPGPEPHQPRNEAHPVAAIPQPKTKGRGSNKRYMPASSLSAQRAGTKKSKQKHSAKSSNLRSALKKRQAKRRGRRR